MRAQTTNRFSRAQTKKLPEKSSKYIFSPEHLLHFYWELMLLLTALYLGISGPYILAFLSNDPYPETFNYIVTGLFILDVFVNFNTACYIKGHIVTDRKTIIKEYLKFWFWVDIISAFPLDIILELLGKNLVYLKAFKIVKIFNVFKFMKIIKLSKIKVAFTKIEDMITSKSLLSVLSVIKLQIYIYLAAHTIACSMFMINSDNLEPKSFANLVLDKCENSFSPTEAYLTAVYWSYATMIGLGYGDIYPVTTSERAFGILCMSISSATFGVILGNISSIINKSNKFYIYRKNVILSTNRYLKVNKIPNGLKSRVKMYLNHNFEKNENEEIDLFDLYKILSEPLCEQIFLYLNGAELESCKIFENFPSAFRRKISRLMHSKTYAPNDDILIETFQPEGIFFIQKGNIHIFDWKSKACIKPLSEGQYFGEIGFFTRRPICASVKCINYAEVIFLACGDFDDVLKIFPAAKEVFAEIQKACSESLAALGVICYLCNELGHVARSCTIIENIRQENREIWLNSKIESRKVDLVRIRRYLRKRKADLKFLKSFGGIKGNRIKDFLKGDEKLDRLAKNYAPKKTEITEIFCRSKENMHSTVLSNIVDDSDEEIPYKLDLTEIDIN